VSTIQRAYKTELDLNDHQVTACRRHAGAARWAYNWGLARKHEAYRATGKSPSAIDLHRELNALKQTTVPWIYAICKCASQEALRNLDSACAHFYRRVQLKQQGKLRGKVGYPTRKTRKRGLGSFRLTGAIVVFPDAIQLPRLGRLRLKERGSVPTTAKILSATVSEQAEHWYVSLLVEQEHVVPANSGPTVGVDLGVKTLATLSDGTTELNPRHVKQRLRKIKRCQRAVSRKPKGSGNRRKAVQRLACLHRTVANQRANTVQQLTRRLAKTKAVVVIADLNASGMLRNHHLAQAISDVGFGVFRRQLTYQAAWYGCRVVLADRWEPSSKICSGCGWVDEELALGDRTFHCRNPKVSCGLALDRDLNAAINLAQLADSSSESQNACGEGSAGAGRTAGVKLPLGKQEPNTFDASAENGKFWRTDE
jgi:putative transposase